MARSGGVVVSAVSAAAPIGKGADVIAFLLQQHADGGEDILVIVDERDIGHEIRLTRSVQNRAPNGQYKPMIEQSKVQKVPMSDSLTSHAIRAVSPARWPIMSATGWPIPTG